MNLRTHRLIRQLHLWIGAWGAIAAILFGISGFMQNHRGIMQLPQGDSTEISRAELDVPEFARTSREALRAWLHDAHHIDVESQRGGRGGANAKRWMFNGGNARMVTQVEYSEGGSTATVRKSQNSPLAVLERLHKGVGGGAAWILLTDSFAIAMVALGISGLILWARGRNAKQMAFSIVGIAAIVLLVIGGSAVV
ncbi:MAG: PepSY-associated TM helix domain-containing protein [Proteobacteria bacterium]|nr:PepSY-associated TM helix domain-containing protein [Pseudomonadota bacterium]